MSNRFRSMKPATPLFFAYDKTGGQSWANTGTWLTYDTIGYNTGEFHYRVDENRVLMKTPINGIYKVTAECSVTAPETTPVTLSIYKNGSVLDGGVSSGNPLTSGQINFPCHIGVTRVVDLNHGDYIQIEGKTVQLTVSTVAHTSRLLIEFLSMRGWDNTHGGKWNYKGVLR